ncbi:hypothetical protein [Massilia sp. ST3]|uniref:putative ABC transporter permease subunit n=1 Tax=Massilia sp. ST3 TaxID=2824903 RepID=UPI001B80FEEC|nr:hypothetical protein [Massilia sp. ST3]MBQ5949309.1 hypothetical protein [Massilia sp. ST3]
MMGAPGSGRWLIAHELRLAWFNAASSSGSASGRRPGNATIALLAGGWVLLHVAAWFSLRRLESFDRTALPLYAAITVVLLVGATAMLSSSLKASVLALFERGDLDLLLSSPLPSHSIFTVRLGAIAASTASVYYFLLAPFAHAGLLLGNPAWLGLYPAVIGLPVLCACAGMLMTLALVRTLGARRTHVVGQVLGALAGASVFIVSQLYMQTSHARRRDVEAALLARLARDDTLGADSALWLPARAVLGDPWPALGLLALAVLAFIGTARTTHRFFVRGLQQSVSQVRTRPAGTKAPRFRFGRSVFDTIVIKEWRLIRRDPHLISQVLLQLLYLLPLCFVVFSRSALQLPAVAAGLALLCGSLAGSLAWIVISAEDAPDLLRSAPAAEASVRLAKLAAAAAPPLAVAALPLAWLLIRAPAAGVLACLAVVGSVWSAALVVLWCGRPGLRSSFKGRGKANFLSNVLEMSGSLCWGALGGLLVAAQAASGSGFLLLGSLAALAGAVLVLLAAWLSRNRQGQAQ